MSEKTSSTDDRAPDEPEAAPPRSLKRQPVDRSARARRKAAQQAAQRAREERKAELAARRAENREGGPRPGPRGFAGRGGGRSSYVEAPPEWRGTTVQVCGLWPFGAGSGTPMIGVPVGRELGGGAALCCDPISWFQRAGLIHNPSCLVLGKPGLGKSSLIRRMVLGLTGFGVFPMVLGDLKPDYVDLISAMNGQIIKLGRGLGSLNVLDPGETAAAAARLSGRARDKLAADAHGRRLNMVSALMTVLRGSPIADTERTALNAALRVLDERHHGVPTLPDLIQVIDQGAEQVRAVTLARGSEDRYRAAVDPLHATLLGLLDGPMGETFARPTTTPIRLDAPGGVCIDISGIDDADAELQAAVLLACWSDGFGAVEAAHALADEGLGPQRHFFVVLDELWRVLRAGRGLVDRVDALTRLNRQRGLGQAMITHTMADLLALPDPADQMKAKGFAERAGMVICGGLPMSEMGPLNEVVRMSAAEQNMIVDWSTPPSWDPNLNRDGEPPGRGKFLVKVGGRPGIPFHVDFTPAERDVNDTNKRWLNSSTRVISTVPPVEPAS
ncbi:AAA-like domain protein [Actinomadura rubteroloni]|uniref:AAA-like domain protein n=1 Tax=Actinomadura rubteroloni TaxID=1926885 RepID=A0A2P4UL28_9ACTN|nr:ATP/GTP-binding protein [Actinomadura rubteroloni]POM25753.1 AAA-like domain protein [Actinomadura rubteroloni]